jgi:hypothetical protein
MSILFPHKRRTVFYTLLYLKHFYKPEMASMIAIDTLPRYSPKWVSGCFRLFLIFTKYWKLKTEFCRTLRFHFSILWLISANFPPFFMLLNVLPQREKTYLFRKKHPSLFHLFITRSLSQYSHLFALSSFSWKVEIAYFPTFFVLIISLTNTRKRYLFWNRTI